MCCEIIEWFKKLKASVHKKIPNAFVRGFMGGLISTDLLVIGIFLEKSLKMRSLFSVATTSLFVIFIFFVVHLFFKSWTSYRLFFDDFDPQEWVGCILGALVGLGSVILFGLMIFYISIK